MAVATRLKEYLDNNNVKYVTFAHSQAFTAQEIAHSMHVKGKELAKVVMVKADDRLVMAVVPAHHKVNLEKLRVIIGAGHTRLASEAEFKGLFPDCEIGAMPIFGNLYGLPVYAAEALTHDEEIVFNAGTHTDSIRMKYADFANLAKPTVAEFSEVV